MRHSVPLFFLLLTTVAACGQVEESNSPAPTVGSTDFETQDAAMPAEVSSSRRQASREAGPNVGPETAPGVAFNYRYAFRLDAERVAEAQQEHQRLCERYTINRCRITGMTYRAVNDEDVEAMLAFRIDPAIAGQFGRESVQAVVRADGALTDSEITGTDVGTSLNASGHTLAELIARLEQIEARLRASDTNPGDKGQLELEAQTLRQQIRDVRAAREGQQDSLATTPMLFRYGSGDLAPGPARPPSLKEALQDTANDFLYSLNILLVVLVRLLPWGLAALLAWTLIRFLRRRLSPRATPAAETVLGA